MTRVNYLIAACSHRAGRPSVFPGTEVLRTHLRELAKTDVRDLAQVTIVRALPLVRDAHRTEESMRYWDVDPRRLGCDVPALGCPVVILDVEDRCFSYSSWMQAIAHFREAFSHYVLLEDDYYPSHSRFVEILLAEHARKLPGGGLLCGFATDHAANANSIVDSATFVRCLDGLDDPVAACQLGQRDFARTFCDDRLADWTDTFRCLHAIGDQIYEQVHGDAEDVPLYAPTEDLIRPVEYLALGERAVRKSISSYPERIAGRPAAHSGGAR